MLVERALFRKSLRLTAFLLPLALTTACVSSPRSDVPHYGIVSSDGIDRGQNGQEKYWLEAKFYDLGPKTFVAYENIHEQDQMFNRGDCVMISFRVSAQIPIWEPLDRVSEILDTKIKSMRQHEVYTLSSDKTVSLKKVDPRNCRRDILV